jgi:hypothetical protein
MGLGEGKLTVASLPAGRVTPPAISHKKSPNQRLTRTRKD